MEDAPGPQLTCSCGAEADDPAGWERGDFEDRCPECRLGDPEGDGETGSSAGGSLGAIGSIFGEFLAGDDEGEGEE